MEKECCKHRKTHRSQRDVELLTNRLSRIGGQINGIKKMIAEDVYCNDVLVQLASVERAVKSVSNIILEDHLKGWITDDLENGKIESMDEVVELFKRFNK